MFADTREDAGNRWIRIDLDPCMEIEIPYLKGTIAPLSVCCISNITCTGANSGPCSFDMKVNYPIDFPSTIHVVTKCNLFAGCKRTSKPVCSQPSPYVAAIKDYLNGIFNFITTYHVNPGASQLSALSPSIFLSDDVRQLHTVALNSASNFVINLTYNDPRGKDKNCAITLQNNSGIVDWNNVKNIINIDLICLLFKMALPVISF